MSSGRVFLPSGAVRGRPRSYRCNIAVFAMAQVEEKGYAYALHRNKIQIFDFFENDTQCFRSEICSLNNEQFWFEH